MSKVSKIFVLDTSVLIHDPECLYSFSDNDICIPMTVIEELDNLKHKPRSDVAHEARAALRNIESILQDNGPKPLSRNEIGEGFGYLQIMTNIPISEKLVGGSNDNMIISTAIHLKESGKQARTSKAQNSQHVVIVSKDTNMRVKARAAGVEAQDYINDQLSADLIESQIVTINHDFWDSFSSTKSEHGVGGAVYHVPKAELEAMLETKRSFLNLWIDDSNGNMYVPVGEADGLVYVECRPKEKLMKRTAWGITPRNMEQAVALDLLLDEEKTFVALNGPAGTGKTLLALASALQQTIEKKIYSKVVIMRSAEAMNDIGFLPGTEQEKMMPWLAGFNDNLEVLCENFGTETIAHIADRANIQFKSLNYIRGASYQKTLLIFDEAQNNTRHQLKSLATRIGMGSKIVMLGNLAQIDTPYLSKTSSGFTHICQKMPAYQGAGVISLQEVTRSSLAEFAEREL